MMEPEPVTIDAPHGEPRRGGAITARRDFRMRWSTVGRAVSALVVVVPVGYLLNRGVYVGSITMLDTASGLVVYEKQCHYFHLDGVHDVRVNAGLDEEDAQQRSCPPFGK